MDDLQGKRVRFVGKLGSMVQKEAAQLVRSHGAVVVDNPSLPVDVIIVGEDELPSGDTDNWLNPGQQTAVADGALEVVSEIDLWRYLGVVEETESLAQFYTPAMLADLLDVPLQAVRRWHRRGLITPIHEVKRLPYFDFPEVAWARRLAQLLAEASRPLVVERKLAELRESWEPNDGRALAELSIIVAGNQILLRESGGLVEPGGQLHIDFESLEESAESTPVISLAERVARDETDPERMLETAAELEDEGELEYAGIVLRAVMAMAGPQPELSFRLAELLYRMGDLTGARERYYIAIELDEDYVEARQNLGCVLDELGELELAEAAFQGALQIYPEYADAHYHLARLLDKRSDPKSFDHWQEFLRLAPDSPWAETARQRLAFRS